MRKLDRELKRWFLNGREVPMHSRISNNGIMQSTHYMCMGISPNRANELQGKHHNGGLRDYRDMTRRKEIWMKRGV